MSLTQTDLLALLEGDITHIRLRNHYPAAGCEKLAAWAALHTQIQNYCSSDAAGRLSLSDTFRIGRPLSEFYTHFADAASRAYPDALDSYLNQDALTEELRRVTWPYDSPIEMLKEQLEYVWPSGVRLAKIGGRSAFAGVTRLIRAGDGSLCPEPHMDWVPETILKYRAQLSGITYLAMPQCSGELEVWKISLDHLKVLANINGRIRRSDLPAPVTIEPKVGDLILINTRRPHAVRAMAESDRIVQTSFIGGDHVGRPLELWS